MRLTVLSVAFPFAAVSRRTAGGAEQILSTLDKSLTAAGHRSVVMAPEGSEVSGLLVPTPRVSAHIEDDEEIRVRHAVRALLPQTIRRFSVDIVHLHGLDCLQYIPHPGLPVVITMHLPLSWYPEEIFQMERRQTTLVCVSAAQAEDWPRQRECEVRERLIIENGIDLQGLRPSTRKGDYLLFLGRICPEKGVHLALDAAAQAGWPLYIAGTAFGYLSHQRYFEHTVKPRLNEKNRFLGQVGGGRKRELLAGARCLLIPSLAPETSSLVAMEALACGTPVIAFDSGALRHIVAHGRTGFLVHSAGEMAEAIDALGRINTGECRQEAERRFSSERMVGQYFDLYNRLAAPVGQAVDSLCLAQR